MNRLIESALTRARAQLHEIADANHDNRVDRRDVEIVMRELEEKVRENVQRFPLGALVTVAGCAAVAAFAIARAFC